MAIPKIQQLELSKVRVSWEDIVEMRDCADEFLVKYWQNNMPQGFKLSEKVPTDQNYVDIEVSYLKRCLTKFGGRRIDSINCK